MLVYLYNPKNREYLYSEEAVVNPINLKTYIMPANSTDKKPLDEKEGYAICWNGNTWIYREDHRGEVWFDTNTRTIVNIDFIGSLPQNFVSPDSKIANPPEGNYWSYNKETDTWVGNVVLFKEYVNDNASSIWNIKTNTPYEFNGFYYLPSWRDLYTSIWTALRDDIKKSYRIQDYKNNYNVVDKNSMKDIMIKMSSVVDEMYNDKHELEKLFAKSNDFNDLKNAFDKWVKKEYK